MTYHEIVSQLKQGMSDQTINPTTKDVLLVLGIGALVISSIVMPGLPISINYIVKAYQKHKRDKEKRLWSRFNQRRLIQNLNRLYQQKIVEITEEEDKIVLKLTDKGKTKYLKYKLEEIMVERPPGWDGKWRVIIYDIRKEKRILSEIFRRLLRKMEFLKLQKSVYLTPYPCEKQIEFLKQYYNLDTEVIYLVVHKIEKEEAYKEYFGLS